MCRRFPLSGLWRTGRQIRLPPEDLVLAGNNRGSETKMKRCFLLVLAMVCFASHTSAQKSVTLEALMSAPFPENLTAAKTSNRVAWTFNQEGKRNIWVAEAPAFAARRLTSYLEDDGQPLSELNFSDDGNTLR